MMPRTTAQVFAQTAAALTQADDATDVLAQLVRDCAQLMSAQAVGLLVVNDRDQLELLASTSHRVAELELFQVQHEAGPCIDAIGSGAIVSASGGEKLRARWSEVGEAIVDAGFNAVTAYPLRWHTRVLGALNVFHTDPVSADAADGELGQALADMSTVALLQVSDMSDQQIASRVQQALETRTVIERAKGVLAHQHDIDMASAYDLLVGLASSDHSALAATAHQVLLRAQHPEAD